MNETPIACANDDVAKKEPKVTLSMKKIAHIHDNHHYIS